MRPCSSDSRSLWTMSASADRPDVMRSNTLLSAWVGRKDVYLDCLHSSETGSRDKERRTAGVRESREQEDTGQGNTGAHFKRNCSESKWALRVMASGFSATASTMGFSTGLMTPWVSDSGSFSQSTRAPSASEVEMLAGSLM